MPLHESSKQVQLHRYNVSCVSDDWARAELYLVLPHFGLGPYGSEWCDPGQNALQLAFQAIAASLPRERVIEWLQSALADQLASVPDPYHEEKEIPF
jgi:hypothetical protein